MPRFSINESSSSSSEDNTVDIRMPKRRRVPFATRVLYRHGTSSSTSTAVAAATLRRDGPSSATPAAAATTTAGASTSQPDSDDSFIESNDDSASEDDEIDIGGDDDDDDDDEEVTPRPAITPILAVAPRPAAVAPRPAAVAPRPAAVASRPAEVTPRTVVAPRPAVASRPAVTPRPLSVVPSGSGGRTSERAGPAVLTDTDVLDCAICFEPFTIPVYQCDNGHTACASCCSKLRNKCPSCCSSIGYNRCRALEKVLEAVKITCVNIKYGCTEKVSYSMKREHERSCTNEPCYCPLSGCGFDGSYKELYLHFAGKHSGSATRFKFGSSFPVHIGSNMKYKFLQEHGHTLFVLNYGVQTIGNVANIICIGSSSLQDKYSYELEVSAGDCSAKLTSLTQSQPKWMAGLPQRSMLLVPKFFIDSSGMHNIQVCIRRKGENLPEISI